MPSILSFAEKWSKNFVFMHRLHRMHSKAAKLGKARTGIASCIQGVARGNSHRRACITSAERMGDAASADLSESMPAGQADLHSYEVGNEGAWKSTNVSSSPASIDSRAQLAC